MNQAEYIDALAAATEFTKMDVKRFLDAQTEIVVSGLTKKTPDDMVMPGLGKFKVRKRKARIGRNPQTGEELKIPARKVPAFSASKAFKEAFTK